VFSSSIIFPTTEFRTDHPQFDVSNCLLCNEWRHRHSQQNLCKKELNSPGIGELTEDGYSGSVSRRIFSVGLRSMVIAYHTFIIQSNRIIHHYLSLKTLKQNPASRYVETWRYVSHPSIFFLQTTTILLVFRSRPLADCCYIHLFSSVMFYWASCANADKITHPWNNRILTKTTDLTPVMYMSCGNGTAINYWHCDPSVWNRCIENWESTRPLLQAAKLHINSNGTCDMVRYKSVIAIGKNCHF
jgi:hypothetical protein